MTPTDHARRPAARHHPQPISLTRLWEILRTVATGMKNARSSRYLCAALGINRGPTAVDLRAAVRELVARGYAIGALPDRGFFVVADRRELDACVRSLHSRARRNIEHATDLVGAFERGPSQAPLPGLEGLWPAAAETVGEPASRRMGPGSQPPAAGRGPNGTESGDRPRFVSQVQPRRGRR